MIKPLWIGCYLPPFWQKIKKISVLSDKEILENLRKKQYFLCLPLFRDWCYGTLNNPYPRWVSHLVHWSHPGPIERMRILISYLIFPWSCVRVNILQSAPCTWVHGVPPIEPLLWFWIGVINSEWMIHKSKYLSSLPVNNYNELCLLNLPPPLIGHLSTEVHKELIIGSFLPLISWPLEQADDTLTPVYCLQITLKHHILHPEKRFLEVSY